MQVETSNLEEIFQTTNLDQFIFRSDNREKVNKCHVQALINSISACNMLEMRPILVNEKMEIIDGQHRVMAAKFLKIPVFYKVEKSLKPTDIVLLSTTKSWTMGDFLNFYVQHDYPEYKKLKEFMRLNELQLRVALNILIGGGHEAHDRFRKGNFLMEEAVGSEDLRLCKETQEIVSAMNSSEAFIYSTRFWKAHLIMTRNENFSAEKWRKNLKQMCERVCVKASYRDYLKLFVDIHNWRNPKKISIQGNELMDFTHEIPEGVKA